VLIVLIVRVIRRMQGTVVLVVVGVCPESVMRCLIIVQVMPIVPNLRVVGVAEGSD
jgi:hypothetical protein